MMDKHVGQGMNPRKTFEVQVSKHLKTAFLVCSATKPIMKYKEDFVRAYQNQGNS